MSDWQDRAACRDTDPEQWFPQKSTDPKAVQKLRQFCHECPVEAECLQHALTHKEEGFWGGLLERERKRILKNKPRQLAPCGTGAAFQRHKRNGETPCDACREAKNAEAREWLAAHPEVAAQRRQGKGYPRKPGPMAGVAS